MAPKLWHWEYFQTRPRTSSTRSDHYGGHSPSRHAWCRACISANVKATEQRDTEDLARGLIPAVRSRDEILDRAFFVVPPVTSRREAFERHIRKCERVSPVAKARLASEHPRFSSRSSPWPSSATSDGSASPQTLLHSTPSPTHYAPSGKQDVFEVDLCKLWVANGSPWRAIDNPETQKFFRKWFPSVTLPESLELSGPILRRELDATYAWIRDTISGKSATGMSHGWRSIEQGSLVSSALSVDYKTYTVQVHNVPADRKTSDDYLDLVLGDIDYAERELKTRVISWVSEASADSRAMRTRLQSLRPEILVFDSWDNQINLVVGDILSRNYHLVHAMDRAIDVVKRILHCPGILEHLHQAQLQNDEKSGTLVLPIASQWTSYFLSARSLLSVSDELLSLAKLDPEAFRPGVRGSPGGLEVFLEVIADSWFWDQLADSVHYLKPLAIATNVSRASSTRLDHVLIELGRLYHIFSNPGYPPEIREAALGSLERRWSKMDQDPVILAVLFNPDIRDKTFKQTNISLNRGALHKAAQRVFRRVFGKEPDTELYDALLDYCDSREEFHPDICGDYCEDYRALCKQKGKLFNLVEVWRGFLGYQTPNTGRHQLVYLAMHVLSIVANSANSEKLFIHTKPRSQNDLDAAVVRANLKRKRLAEERSRSMVKNRFGASIPDTTTSAIQPGDLDEESLDAERTDVDSIPSMRSLVEKLYQDVLDDEDEGAPMGKGEEPTQTSELGAPPEEVRPFFGAQVSIPLRDLFQYTSGPEAEGHGLDIFKSDGLENLQKEFERYALTTRSMLEDLESDDATVF